MHPLTFRRATVADIPALVALVTSSYRGDSSRQGWTTEADLLDGNRIDPELLRADIERPQSLVLVAERPGERTAMVACAHVCVEAGAGYFGMFAVRPGLQGGGLGRTVLEEAERIAADEFGVPVMRMSVIDCRDELIGWYQRRGYCRTGLTRPFPYGDERFGIPKRPDLRFEVLEKPLRIHRTGALSSEEGRSSVQPDRSAVAAQPAPASTAGANDD
jgi:ribosomal protein S18 acetylase RimI-like enzyme